MKRNFSGGSVVKTVLPLHSAGICFLVGELRSCKPHGMTKKKKKREDVKK